MFDLFKRNHRVVCMDTKTKQKFELGQNSVGVTGGFENSVDSQCEVLMITTIQGDVCIHDRVINRMYCIDPDGNINLKNLN